MRLWKLTGLAVVLALAGVGAFLVSRPGILERHAVVDFDNRSPVGEADQADRQASTEVVIKFGFDIRANPEEDARQYLPFLEYLRRATGLEFKLVFTAENKRLYDQLGRGEVDIAAVGAVSFIRAQDKYGAVPLARGLNSDNRAEYQSMIVVAPDSSIGSVPELRGKRFAFGNVDSTQGHIIPRIILLSKGVGLESLAHYEFTGSHKNCAAAVLSGHTDACGMQDTMAKALARQGKLRILHMSEYFPSSGIAANKSLPPEQRALIRQALVDFEPNGRHKEGLYLWYRTEMPNGFVAAEDGDYSGLRQWILKLNLTF